MTLRVPFWSATPRVDIPPDYLAGGSGKKLAMEVSEGFGQRAQQNSTRSITVGSTVGLGAAILGLTVGGGPTREVLATAVLGGFLLGGLIWGIGESGNYNSSKRPRKSVDRLMFELRELMPNYLQKSFNVRAYLKLLATEREPFRKVRIVCQLEVPKEAPKESYRIAAARLTEVPGDIGDVFFHSDDQIHIVSSDIKTRFDVGNSIVTTNYPVDVWFLSVLENRIALWPQAPKLVSIRCEDDLLPE